MKRRYLNSRSCRLVRAFCFGASCSMRSNGTCSAAMSERCAFIGRTRPSCTRWNSPTVWPGSAAAGSSPDFALEGGFQLAQRGVFADAADEPARDLIAALVIEVARRLGRQHHAEAGGAGALQQALQRLGGRRLGVRRNVEVGFVEHDDGLEFVVGVALAEAQRLRQELRDPEQDVLVVAQEARVDDRTGACGLRRADTRPRPSRLSMRRLSPPPSKSAALRRRSESSWATRSRRSLPDGSMRCVRSVSSGCSSSRRWIRSASVTSRSRARPGCAARPTACPTASGASPNSSDAAFRRARRPTGWRAAAARDRAAR